MRKPAASHAFAGPLSTTEALLAAAVLAALASPGAAQQQFEELGKRALPATREVARAVGTGDFDFDGDLDVVFGNHGQTRLHLNNGSGLFDDVTAARMPIDGEVTYDIAVGDVDGDGDLDLAVAKAPFSSFPPSTTQNRLYLNDGTGAFVDATAGRLPSGTVSANLAVALGDVDGDGDLDLVAGTRGEGTRLYVNDGTGTFTEAAAGSMPAAVDHTNAVVLGDVDGDGDLDLALGNGLSSYVPGSTGQNRLLLNDGTGRFTDATGARMPVLRDSTTSAALGDIDADGDLDLFFGNSLGFSSPPAPQLQNRLLLNDGTGTFTDVTSARLPADSDSTSDVAIGDVDSDGDLDLLSGSPHRIYLNDSAGFFTEAVGAMPARSRGTSAMALGDVDGDGDPDLPSASLPRNALYLNDGDGVFADATASRGLPAQTTVRMLAIAFGDVDGDGDTDLVGGGPGQSRLYLNDGRGTFDDATAARLPAGSYWTAAIALGDVDGDGDLDLVLGNGERGGLYFVRPMGEQNRLYLNDGSGTFTDATAERLPADDDNTLTVVFADVDGDRDLDLVMGNYYSEGQNKLYLNDGAGTFVDATATRMPNRTDSTLSVAAGDVDGDGDVDLVFGQYYTYGNELDRLYLNDGTGRFTDATSTRMPADSHNTTAVALADVDADGDLDLVVGTDSGFPAARQDRLYVNDGTGTFTDVTSERMPALSKRTFAMAVGDVDLDGDADLVLGDSSQDRLYVNDGAGTFTDATTPRMPIGYSGNSGVALHDVDADGDPDFVSGHSYGRSSAYPRLHFNLARQLDAPFLLRVGHDFRLDAHARYGPSRELDLAVGFLSTGTASIPLPPLGTFGLDPASLLPLPPFVIDPVAGVGSLTLRVPNQPSLGGVPIHAQALLLRIPGASRLTNVTDDVVWR